MADKELVNLPAAPAFRDDALLLVYLPGSSEPAQKLTGAQLREYAETAGAAAAAHVKKGDKGDPGDVSSVNGVQPDAKGNVTLTPAQIGALPLDGSAAMTGRLDIKASDSNSTTQVINNASQTVVRNIADNNNYTDITMAEGIFQYTGKKGGASFRYDILHEGNKPHGVYTGNGSEATRFVETKGLGHLILIRGAGCITLLSYGTAMVLSSGGVKPLTGAHCYFANGVLQINTTEVGLNQNGVEYDYFVL